MLEGRAYVSTILFNSRSTVIHDRVDLNDVKPLTRDDYRPCGGTALLDAIGGAIHHIGNVHKYARPEDVPEKTVFVITTDGMENASHIYDSDTVKAKIKRQTEERGWEFIFLAANIDAVETAGNIGIRQGRAMNFEQDHAGVRESYSRMSNFMCCMRVDPKAADKDLREMLAENGKED